MSRLRSRKVAVPHDKPGTDALEQHIKQATERGCDDSEPDHGERSLDEFRVAIKASEYAELELQRAANHMYNAMCALRTVFLAENPDIDRYVLERAEQIRANRERVLNTKVLVNEQARMLAAHAGSEILNQEEDNDYEYEYDNDRLPPLPF